MMLRTLTQAVELEPALGTVSAFRQAVHRKIYPSYKVTPTHNGRVLVDLDEIREILVARCRIDAVVPGQAADPTEGGSD